MNKFDANSALAPLKFFQRRTVDYVFDRLYGNDDPVRQFLVADEVGLGKTMVARGVIAKAIEKLWDTTDRIDILYICSNQAIAAQNLNRLNVLNRKELALPTRMTLIPLQMRGERGLESNKVNFISLTPGTTFDLRSTTGVLQERALLLKMLEDCVSRPRGLHNMLQVAAGVDGWNGEVSNLTLSGVDQKIVDRFRKDILADIDLFEELELVCDLFPRRRDSYPYETTQRRNVLVGKLRGRLSHACVHALKPDLIIMDEFQRFRELLHGLTPASDLARELFEYSDSEGHLARTLLLSATPYKMLSLAGEDSSDGEHYRDFLETVSFLYGKDKGPEIAKSLKVNMSEFRSFLHDLPRGKAQALISRNKIEQNLRKVMSRTERVSSTTARDSMVEEPPMNISVMPMDLKQVLAMSEVCRVLDEPLVTEYWKSAPYLLNFMREYSLKRKLKESLDKPSSKLLCAVESALPSMLSFEGINRYEPIDIPNGRMRGVMEDVFGSGLDKQLWIPPSLPYYGAKSFEKPLTKALIFSSWSMVPDAIAAIFSYEAERKMGVGDASQQYFSSVRPRPIQFRKDQSRLVAMRAMNLVYPSPTLARIADPLAIFGENKRTLSTEEMRRAIADRLRASVVALKEKSEKSSDSRDWEWAGPAAIDAMAGAGSVEWVESDIGFAALGNEEGFKEHVLELRTVATKRTFGPVPDTLIDLLVDVALGSPAVCALRALHRIASDFAWDDHRLLTAANKISWGFRTLFNQHDAVAMLRKDDDNRYWHRVLTYGVENNLQAVLDEYIHYLVDAEGLAELPSADKISGISDAVSAVLSIRPSQIEVDDLAVKGRILAINKLHMRGRFAMRLSDYKDEDGGSARLSSVRDAFNSPFRPFVLATTSVGQEGLDFHPYCYRLYHWNLPRNPVDFEQREGRIHRYKGHAIRLNLAHAQIGSIQGNGSNQSDPWKKMFETARRESLVDTDLIPYWIYEGPVKVERRVPNLPFSREVSSLEWLKRSLTIYRLTFGQPRQEDLLQYLHTEFGENVTAEELAELQIRLDPCALRNRQ